MLELYQDAVNDLLLAPDKLKAPPRLEIKKDAKGWVTVANSTMVPVASEEEIMHVIDTGLSVRKTTSTKMNMESSRSHLIFSLVIESTDLQTQAVTRGKLSFVDLAGSERVKKSGAEGDTMKEAQAINKSLSALGNVISALATEQAHIPYRDHKLTMLMSDSLGEGRGLGHGGREQRKPTRVTPRCHCAPRVVLHHGGRVVAITKVHTRTYSTAVCWRVVAITKVHTRTYCTAVCWRVRGVGANSQ